MKRVLFTLALLLVAHSATAGVEDTFGLGPAPMALGGSYAARPGDSAAAYYNPAGLAQWGHKREHGGFFELTLGAIYAHPTLDCNRRPGAATATTGVLYVAAGSGRVAAIIVDSPKLLDATDVWPKFQRTAGNAGNTDATRFPFNPGCP